MNLLLFRADLGDINDTEYNWAKAVLPANMLGQKVTLSLEDANGDEAWSEGVSGVCRNDS